MVQHALPTLVRTTNFTVNFITKSPREAWASVGGVLHFGSGGGGMMNVPPR